MSEHSIVEAKNQLSALIERAHEGEAVIITRHGEPVAEIKPLRPVRGRPMTEADVEALLSKAVKLTPGTNAVEELIRMRDEDDERLLRR